MFHVFILFFILFFSCFSSFTIANESDHEPLTKQLKTDITAISKDVSDDACQKCHGEKGFQVKDSKKIQSLHIDKKFLQQSVHGKYRCVDCHQDINELPHKKIGLDKVDCISCHLKLEQLSAKPRKRVHTKALQLQKVINHSRDYTLSAHADKSKKNNASCATCHTAHYVFSSQDKRASTYKMKSPKLCGACHEKQLVEYKKSMHGATISRPWLGDSATCSDCHSSHKISDVEKLPAHRVVTENCGGCHEDALNGYMSSPHGQLAWHGNNNAPKCVDCHGGHDIVHINESNSPVQGELRIETCQQCHENANSQFVKYHPHGIIGDFDKYPMLWIFGNGMGLLIIAVMLFFYSHSVLWFYREWKERPSKWYKWGTHSYALKQKQKKFNSGVHYQRFSWEWRMNHWILAISLMTLVFTGMAVMYPNTTWAMWVVPTLGGTDVFNVVHRISGVIFLLAVFGHAFVVLSRIGKNKDFDWFGPNSLLPRKKDWEDMKGQFRWFFGKGKQPRFDRWTYWEKFDYWAVYWGAFVIGFSGILLWFSETIGNILPGWIFNLATIAHGLEAFLAVMTLFVVHFFNNHFRPLKFPLDIVMFTGTWDLEEFKEERPEQYERLKASGELEQYLVSPPTKRWNLVSHILGFTLLTIGLLLLIMVIDGYFTRGLF